MEKKETILAVDDNEVNLIMLRAILSQYYEVITASDGTQAEIMAIERNPDLILLDVMMPVKNGFETCKILKAWEQERLIMFANPFHLTNFWRG